MGGQAVEPIGIQQQQASEILQLSFECAAAQPGAIGHRIEALQGRLWLGQQHMGQHLPELLGQGLWHHPFQPTNAAAAGGFQAQPRGTEVVAAAGKHPQPAPSVLGGGQRRLRPGGAAAEQIRAPQAQARLLPQAGQNRCRQAQGDALLLAHPGHGAVLPEASLPQPNDQAALAAGGAIAGGLACVAIEAAGAIDAPDQATAALARLQQLG